MKILSIKISNILSFKYFADMTECPKNEFDKNLNILIGPNGSGKSNFIEIINQVFKKGICLPCEFNFQNMFSYEKDSVSYNLESTITVRDRVHTLSKNYNSKSDDQEVHLKLELSENDYENLIFILNNVSKINELLKNYTNVSQITFNENATEDGLKNIKKIEFYVKSSAKKQFSRTTDVNGIEGQFVQDYFEYFDVIQNLILVSNYRDKTNWRPLKNTFALIGSYRNYNVVESLFNLNQHKFEKLKVIKDRIIEDSTRISKNEEPVIFEYLKNKLSFRLHNIEFDLSEGKLKNPHTVSAFEFLKKELEYATLNKLLNDYLSLSLKITHKRETMEYNFNFVDLKEEKIVLIQDLSAGEKGIIHFIFSIYGYDLESGAMVIDEPELHLHPQIQQKYLDIISDTIQNLDLQFIIATHSPIFVNKKTIEHTYRFYKDEDDFTQITTCSTISTDMRSRIQMLSYTNSAIIFFVEKVILTEGYRDRIFFKKYLENYKERHRKDISKIEILEMGGKGEYEKWHKFLKEFEIKTYYIGDADNLKHSYISPNSAKWNTLFSGEMLRNDILSLKQNEPSEYQNLVNEIKQHYDSDIYLLQNGEFEDYFEQMTNESKSTKGVTSFCLSDKFENWINSSYYHPYAIEIEGIMFQIIN